MKEIGHLVTTRTYKGRTLHADVYEFKTVYHVYARWAGEDTFCINGHKVTKRIKTMEEALQLILSSEWTKKRIGIA